MNECMLQQMILLWEERTVFWKTICTQGFCFHLLDRKAVAMWSFLLIILAAYLNAFNCSVFVRAPLSRTTIILLLFLRRDSEVFHYFRSLFLAIPHLVSLLFWILIGKIKHLVLWCLFMEKQCTVVLNAFHRMWLPTFKVS